MAPHQEPRFLLPLLRPIVHLTAVAIRGAGSRARRWIWVSLICLSCSVLMHQTTWIAHSIALVLVFGVAHQGGVVPALVAVNARLRSAPPAPSQVVVWRTYMPPRHLVTPVVAGA